jgi:hypothetical protein
VHPAQRQVSVTRWVGWATVAVVAAALLAAAAFVLLALRRPTDGVEAEVLFEAQRIRAGLPLYVDPLVGALEYGEPPSRYYVLYPPVWPATVALFPSAAVARLVSLAAWWGVLAWAAARAPREQRLPAFTVAAFVASFQTLVQFGATARPDSVAVALAGVALARALELDRLDALAATLFAMAFWTKPNVVGLGAGVLFASLLREPRATARALLAPIALSAGIATALQVVSNGAWIEHLRRATLQAWSLHQWLAFFPSRLPFLGSLLVAAGILAWARRDLPAARLAGAAMLASCAWMALCMGKAGSQNNYWLEPTMGAAIVAARIPFPRWSARATAVVACLACAQAFYSDVGSVCASLEETAQARAWEAAMGGVRALVGARPDEIIVGSPGVELDLDGRVVQTPFQMTNLVERGLFPVEPWIAQLTHPRVAGLITRDVLGQPGDPLVPDSPEHGFDFPQAVRARLEEEFVFVAAPNPEWRIYARRRGRAAPAPESSVGRPASRALWSRP